MRSFRLQIAVWGLAFCLGWSAVGVLSAGDSKNPPAEPSDPVAGRTHWAFQTLADGLPPPVRDRAWSRSAIDQFVLARLESDQLHPVADAEPRTLLRRVYFQLTGLPPTPDDIADFLREAASSGQPDALQRVVDRLLASPRYGERWGRHWLDQARYADSNGLDENFLFREAWRYRNWVIAAVNADVPFDRFLAEQLAGDLLPFDSLDQRDRQRIAAGFLVIGPKVLLGNDPNQRRMDVADEQLDTVGRAVLAQTLGCARCHDHKFDPVPTADYYALAGIFTSTQVMQTRFMLNEQRHMERLVGLGADGDQLNDAYEKYWREMPQRREREKHAKAALEALERDDAKALEELVSKHADAIAPNAKAVDAPKEQRVAAQKELLDGIRAELAKPPAIPPRAMIPADVEKPADEAIRLSGQFNKPGDVIPRGFLRVINEKPAALDPGKSGRLELSRWLTDAQQGAGQLAARVRANRIWHYLYGRGLVRTVDNFGRTGETPSHPELLDYIARRQLEAQWSTKSLVRELVLSRVFQLSSQSDAAAYAVDPDNRLLWRGQRHRLEPEALHDAMLAAAGQLDLRPADSTVAYLGDQATAVGDNKNRRRTDYLTRSVYLPVIRNDLPELFEVFDFANPHASIGMRPQTMVASQGLFLLNDVSVLSAAEAMAKRLLAENLASDDQRIAFLYAHAVGGEPTAEERGTLLAYVQKTRERLRGAAAGADVEPQAWALACHAVFATTRFQILD